MSLLKEIAKGAAWSTGSTWVVQVLQFAISIILARILSPKDYGIVAMSFVFTNFVQLFGNLGFGPALVYKKDLDDTYISVAFTVIAAIGAGLFVIIWFVAPFVGSFYNEPIVGSIVRVVALGLIFSPVNGIWNNLLIRAMRFKEIAIIDVSSNLASQVIALSAALSGLGLWSLVLGGVAYQLIRMPLFLWYTRWVPRISFHKNSFKELFGYGGNLMAFSFVNYFSRNMDNLIIGRVLGPITLGYYDLAYQTMVKLLNLVSNTITRPLFPALSRIQDDKPKVREIYLRVISYIALITFPMMFGLLSVAHVFVPGVLGDKWSPAIPILQILAVAGAVQSIYGTVGDIYQSQGQTRLMLKTGSLGAAIYVSAFLIGIHWGIIGVATACMFGSLLYGAITQYIACRVIDLGFGRFLNTLLPHLIRSIIMALVVYACSIVMVHMKMDLIFALICLVILGAGIYFITILLAKSSDLEPIKRFLKSKG